MSYEGILWVFIGQATIWCIWIRFDFFSHCDNKTMQLIPKWNWNKWFVFLLFLHRIIQKEKRYPIIWTIWIINLLWKEFFEIRMDFWITVVPSTYSFCYLGIFDNIQKNILFLFLCFFYFHYNNNNNNDGYISYF